MCSLLCLSNIFLTIHQLIKICIIGISGPLRIMQFYHPFTSFWFIYILYYPEYIPNSGTSDSHNSMLTILQNTCQCNCPLYIFYGYILTTSLYKLAVLTVCGKLCLTVLWLFWELFMCVDHLYIFGKMSIQITCPVLVEL